LRKYFSLAQIWQIYTSRGALGAFQISVKNCQNLVILFQILAEFKFFFSDSASLLETYQVEQKYFRRANERLGGQIYIKCNEI